MFGAAFLILILLQIVDTALTTSKAGVVKLRKEIVVKRGKSISATGNSLDIVGVISNNVVS